MSNRDPQRLRTTRALAFSSFASVVALAGCREELGECDSRAANELVYGRSGLVATKGQALLHDSCGGGSFCHSAAAKDSARQGVAKGLDFDMLPRPASVARVAEMREEIWQQIVDGAMPPKGFTMADGDWRFDVERRPDSAKLPALSTSEGKGALRNWLACGAPTVADTQVPPWAAPATETHDPQALAWTDLHTELRNTCVSSGCHDGSLPGDAGSAGFRSVPLSSEECVVYRWLLFSRDQCGGRLVVGGDPEASALVRKLSDQRPACGEPMPPPASDKMVEAETMSALLTRVQDWITAGAVAPQCGHWSDRAPRTNELDSGVPSGPRSWNELHQQILVPRCATSTCHDSKTKAGELELTQACEAWQGLQRSGPCGARVVPGKPGESSLYTKLTQPRCGGPMPPTQSLPGSEIEALRAWIEAGASAEGCE